MDQLKQYWEIVKKQHFWILCGLAVLAPLIASLIANGYLAKVYGDQKGKITQISGDLSPLVSADHPNSDWVKHVHEETERLRYNVLGAWKSLYKQQSAVLKWPAGLGADFIAKFSQPAAADDPRALEPLCERYQNFVKTELSQMADIVKAEWVAGESGAEPGAGPRRGRAEPAATPEADNPDAPKKTYIVDWNPTDQSQLVADFDWQDPPSPLDVRYAQEELWVLEAILKSIDRTNVGATGDFDAVVRQIDSTLIGYDATDKFPLGEGADRIYRSGKGGQGNMANRAAPPQGPGAMLEPKRPVRHRTTDEGALGGQGRMGGRKFDRGGGGPNQAGPAGSADPDAWLKDGRYVDSNGKPLLGSDWANSTSPEFNQMAFKLVIVADEQRWQKLLVELCNSQLPLEVREVRIDAGAAEGAGGNPRERGRPGRAKNDQEGQDNIMHNVTLEIRGVAYLINPPNLAKLGITAADAGAAPADAPIAPPAVAPPAVEPAAAPATVPAAVAPTAPATPNTAAPGTVAPGAAAPTATPPAAVPPALTPPVAAPATAAPAAVAPVTGLPPAATTPTTVPPTAAPPTSAPPTAAPPTAAPPTTTPPAVVPASK